MRSSPKLLGALAAHPKFPIFPYVSCKDTPGNFSHPFATVLQNGEARGPQSALNFYETPIPPSNVGVDFPVLLWVFHSQHWVGVWGVTCQSRSNCIAMIVQVFKFVSFLKLKFGFSWIRLRCIFHFPVYLCTYRHDNSLRVLLIL